MPWVISSCTTKMSSTLRSYFSAQMISGVRFDQLRRHPNALAGLLHAAFQHVANAKFARDLACIDRAPLVSEGRVAGDHKEARQPRQERGDVLGDTVGKEFLRWITAHLVEGQHSNRWFIGKRESRLGFPAFRFISRDRRAPAVRCS